MNTPFVFFFAVNTLKDTSGFFNMVLLIYGVRLPSLCQKPQIYLDIWSNEYITKRKRDIEAEFTDALERKHQKSKEEFMKKKNQWNDDLEGET